MRLRLTPLPTLQTLHHLATAPRRAYLRQRIKWATQDAEWMRKEYAALPAKQRMHQAFIDSLRTELSTLEP